MIAVQTNLSQVVARLQSRLTSIKNQDQLLRTLATNARAAMKYRIHTLGLDSTEKAIGTYSAPYMKVRTGDFGNSTLFTKGAKKGKTKDAGLFTKGDRKGQTRPKYNRSNDPKVVISLTRQMENDMVIVPTAKGYGVGYNNPDNFKKVGYVEHTYNKEIFKSSPSELQMFRETAEQFASNPDG